MTNRFVSPICVRLSASHVGAREKSHRQRGELPTLTARVVMPQVLEMENIQPRGGRIDLRALRRIGNSVPHKSPGSLCPQIHLLRR